MVSKTVERKRVFSWNFNFETDVQDGDWFIYYYDPNGTDLYKIKLDAATKTQAKALIAQITAWMNKSETWSGTVVEYQQKKVVTHPAVDVEEWTVVQLVGTWTYVHTTNVITVTGGTAGAPCGFVDAWNADKAGTLENVHARNVVAADGADVAVDHAERPTDMNVLGLADIFITITNFTANGSILITGTEEYGAAQTETIAFTGNGVYNSTLYWKTITHTRVTVYANTFTYTLSQGQWGVVWKQGTTQYQIDSIFAIGDSSNATVFTDTSKLVVFTVTGGQQVKSYANSTVTFGTLNDAATYSTKNGCTFISTGQASAAFWTAYGGTVNWYSCTYIGTGIANWVFSSAAGGYVKALYNCRFENVKSVTSYGSTFDLYNVYVGGSQASLADATSNPTVNYLTCKASQYAIIFQGSSNLTVRNLIGGNQSLKFIYVDSLTVHGYLIDTVWLDSANWTITWAGVCTGNIYRQYTFNLKVTDKDNVAISGATVVLKDNAGTQIFSVTTDVNGDIVQQTVSRGYYNQANGNTLQDYSPHTLTITKAGYQRYTKVLTLTEKTIWQIALFKRQDIFFNVDGVKTNIAFNLESANPENNKILGL